MENSAVATGYLVKVGGNFSDYCRIVFQNIRHKETGRVYESKEMVKFFQENYDCNRTAKVFFDELVNTGYEVQLYPDIFFHKDTLKYKHNPNIKIGCPHDKAVMLYLSCITRRDQPVLYTEQDFLTIMAFKNKLLQQGRIDTDLQFCTITNEKED